MSEGPALALVYSSRRDWTSRLHHHVVDHGGATVAHMVVEEQTALTEEYEVFVCDDTTSFLSESFVERLSGQGVRFLGIYEEVAPEGKDRLLSLGFHEVLPHDASVEEFMHAIFHLWEGRDTRHIPSVEAVHEGDFVSSLGVPSAPGEITVVGGPMGGVGATELSIELARASAKTGALSVLVDADDTAPAIAQRLRLPMAPNIRTAVEGWSQRQRYVVDCLFPLHTGHFRVLVGLRHAKSWTHIDPDEAVGMVQYLATLHHHVILNVGSNVEIANGPMAQRYALTRALLLPSSHVVGVCLANPVSMCRLIEWAAAVRQIGPGADLHLVVNRAPSERLTRDEITSVLSQHVEPVSISFLPDDRNFDSAVWNGDLLRSGSYTKAVARFLPVLSPVLGSNGAKQGRKGRSTKEQVLMPNLLGEGA